MGNPQAKVTVVEYASVACPHCGRFNNEVFPAFKAKYIDTGKVHYVFREMLVGNGQEQAFGAAGFLLARCAGQDKYFSVLDAIFHGQGMRCTNRGDLRGGLLSIAQGRLGMTETAVQRLRRRPGRAEGDERPRSTRPWPRTASTGTPDLHRQRDAS